MSSSDGLDFDYDSSRKTASMRMASGQTTYDAEYAGRDQFERVELEGAAFVDTVLGTSYRDDGPDEQAYRRSPDGNLVGVDDDGDRHYYLTDAQGTIAAVVDDAGKVTNRYSYSPYGQTSEVSGATESGASAVEQPFRYTGQYQDPTGLYKMGIRYYHPDLARWTQPDPAYNRTNLPAGNLYAYANCDPVNNTDPTGAIWCPVGVAGTLLGAFSLGVGLATLPLSASALAIAGVTAGIFAEHLAFASTVYACTS